MKKYTPNQVLDLVLSISEEAALSLLQVGLRCLSNPDEPYFSDENNYEFGLDNWPSSHDWRIHINDKLLLLYRFEKGTDTIVNGEHVKCEDTFVLFGAAPLLL